MKNEKGRFFRHTTCRLPTRDEDARERRTSAARGARRRRGVRFRCSRKTSCKKKTKKKRVPFVCCAHQSTLRRPHRWPRSPCGAWRASRSISGRESGHRPPCVPGTRLARASTRRSSPRRPPPLGCALGTGRASRISCGPIRAAAVGAARPVPRRCGRMTRRRRRLPRALDARRTWRRTGAR